VKRKGVMGKALTLIISLILGLAALALLWVFLAGSTKIINAAAQKIIIGFRCSVICEGILEKGGFLTEGIAKGMCGGC